MTGAPYLPVFGRCGVVDFALPLLLLLFLPLVLLLFLPLFLLLFLPLFSPLFLPLFLLLVLRCHLERSERPQPRSILPSRLKLFNHNRFSAYAILNL
jgi:hypothetical protein